MAKDAITAREKDYSRWYLDIVEQADLSEDSGVRGCMVIKPKWLRHLGADPRRHGRAY